MEALEVGEQYDRLQITTFAGFSCVSFLRYGTARLSFLIVAPPHDVIHAYSRTSLQDPLSRPLPLRLRTKGVIPAMVAWLSSEIDRGLAALSVTLSCPAVIGRPRRPQRFPSVVFAREGRLQLQRKSAEEVAGNRNLGHSLPVCRLGGGGFSMPSPGPEAMRAS